MDHIYDVIILGAGPAGLSAGLYAGRSRLDTLIIGKRTGRRPDYQHRRNRKLSGTDRRRRDGSFSCTQNVRTGRTVRRRTCP